MCAKCSGASFGRKRLSCWGMGPRPNVPQAQKTEYVGRLKHGKARGFRLLLATPYRGRAVPCAFLTCSSRTIAARDGSRNLNHFRGIEQAGELLGERPLVLDREFRYLELLQEP